MVILLSTLSPTVTPKLADKKASGFASQKPNNEQGSISLFLNQEISWTVAEEHNSVMLGDNVSHVLCHVPCPMAYVLLSLYSVIIAEILLLF